MIRSLRAGETIPARFSLSPGGALIKEKEREKRVRINEQIRLPEIRVIDSEGKQLGILQTQEALKMAEEQGLDLVEIAPTSRPPVCKIMDFGKFKYEQSKKARESRKKQHTTHLKEIKIRPKIEEHDLEFKLRNAEKFLTEKDKVKITVIFRGREMEHMDMGRKILDQIVTRFSDIAIIEKDAIQVGKMISMILGPRSDRKGG
ncbi:MAG: translation initiation factor IF-3 [Candidatus Krumholzibacteria bacterium]|nr:translation initiation factor IF-3 [Candidatus Krumholzibacteria bacterium]